MMVAMLEAEDGLMGRGGRTRWGGGLGNKAPAGAGPRTATRSPCPWALDSSGAIGQRYITYACRHSPEVRKGWCASARFINVDTATVLHVLCS